MNDRPPNNSYSAPVAESALIERAKARSPEAWTTIYDHHYQPVFRYIHARVFDRDTAADLTANVFLAAITGIGNYRYTGRPLLAWLYRIAHNVVTDHQRRTLGRQGLSHVKSSLRVIGGVFSHESREATRSFHGEPDAMAERLDLHRAVSKLPESQREVLILRYLVGLNAEEVANVVGKERAAVYSLHARAIASLRESMAVDTAGGRIMPARDKTREPASIDMVKDKRN